MISITGKSFSLALLTRTVELITVHYEMVSPLPPLTFRITGGVFLNLSLLTCQNCSLQRWNDLSVTQKLAN